MKRVIVGALMLFLLACTEAPPVMMAPTEIVLTCQGYRDIGESCTDTCECLKPGKCMQERCALTGLQEGQPCFANMQCSTGKCMGNYCIAESSSYQCEIDCKERYDDSERCQTLCNR